jgi:hypothetical protein
MRGSGEDASQINHLSTTVRPGLHGMERASKQPANVFWPRAGIYERMEQGVVMPCQSRESAKQAEFTAEILIHFPGLKNLDKPAVWLFPKLLVCLECGSARFNVPETELASIAKATVASESSTLEETAGDVARSRETVF